MKNEINTNNKEDWITNGSKAYKRLQAYSS